ncbi:MAG: Diaminopimelate epimerase [Candidatus Methanoperedenaceae archaeon GB50]|nr:MAG: Diaminopimelate epimerase [Candidatus Methanoperedenaceae archaeon GB50]
MKNITFYKMTGSGNDFILIDDMKKVLDKKQFPFFAHKLCRRTWSVGADGLIILRPSDKKADFKWYFYNADGSEAEMCGNGGRCAARLAHLLGITGQKLSFETKAGIIQAEVEQNLVKLQLPPPTDLDMNIKLTIENSSYTVHFINTGVPHTIFLVKDLEKAPVLSLGRKIRFHSYFQPAGTNVDFVKVLSENGLEIRTYERGVEGETLACGTGAVASAIVAYKLGLVASPVKIKVRSGEILEVFFSPDLKEAFLKGEVRLVCKGKICEEALK